MRHGPLQGVRHFFATAPLPCPYLPDRLERRVVTELVGRDSVALHDALSLAGFRRSHGVAYAPACLECQACVPVRVMVERFHRSRGLRRAWNHNQDLVASETGPIATQEQFTVFAAYQASRHGDGDMAAMDFLDYRALVEDTTVETTLVEFRASDASTVGGLGPLVAGCLIDHLGDGLSAVYSFFDPALSSRGLGTFMVVWLVERARQLRLPYLYLGYWIAECRKMSYKTRFGPLEGLGPEGWHPLDG